MAEAIKKSIEASIVKLLQDAGKGLSTAEFAEAIDEAESTADVIMVLGDMSRRGLVVADKASKLWCWNGDAAATAPPPAKKLHEIAEAILAAFAGREVGALLTAGELCSICSQWSAANVSYHIKALKNAGLIVPAKKGKGYVLPAAPKPAVRRPNTALLSEAAQRHTPGPVEQPLAPIPPAAPEATPAAEHPISVELTCPAGRIKLDGTPKFVFDFLDQLKALAA